MDTNISPLSTIDIDPNGDLYLAVSVDGKPKNRFRVSSNALRLASPVWRAMLEPEKGFKESLSSTTEIQFVDDQADVLYLILLATHFKFLEMPVRMEIDRLADLFVLCDKYDCLGVIQPWTPAWISKLSKIEMLGDFGEWLTVTWFLGDEENFQKAAKGLIRTCRTNSKWQCLSPDKRVLEERLPPGLSDLILKVRLFILTLIVKECHKVAETYGSSSASSSGRGCRIGNTGPAKDQCDALVFGHMITQFMKLGIWPGKASGLVSGLPDMTIEHLTTQLDALKDYTFIERVEEPERRNYGHYQCGFFNILQSLLQPVIARVPAFFTTYKPKLEAQRQKLQPPKATFTGLPS